MAMDVLKVGSLSGTSILLSLDEAESLADRIMYLEAEANV